MKRENPATVFALRVTDGNGTDYGIKFNGSDDATPDPPTYLQKLHSRSEIASEAIRHGASLQRIIADLSKPLVDLSSRSWLSAVRLERLPITAAYSSELDKQQAERFILDALSDFGVDDLENGSLLLANSYMAIWLRDESQEADESQARTIIRCTSDCFEAYEPMRRREKIGLIASEKMIVGEGLILAVFDHWHGKQEKSRSMQANVGRPRS